MPRLGFGAPIEALWLLTIVSVPLVFGPPGWLAFFEVPKIALMRTLVALILAAWTLDVALRVAARGLPAAAGWRERAAGWLIKHGITRFNIDLMYGLPHQTLDGFSRLVDFVAGLGPGRVAVFGYAHVPWMRAHQKLIDEALLPDGAGRLRAR